MTLAQIEEAKRLVGLASIYSNGLLCELGTALDLALSELDVTRKLYWLLAHDHVFLSGYNEDKGAWDDGTYPAINCNDFFVCGSDAEPLAMADLDLFTGVVKKWPNTGSYAWCSVKRNAKPWRTPSKTEWLAQYEEALAGIPAMMKAKP